MRLAQRPERWQWLDRPQPAPRHRLVKGRLTCHAQQRLPVPRALRPTVGSGSELALPLLLLRKQVDKQGSLSSTKPQKRILSEEVRPSTPGSGWVLSSSLARFFKRAYRINGLGFDNDSVESHEAGPVEWLGVTQVRNPLLGEYVPNHRSAGAPSSSGEPMTMK